MEKNEWTLRKAIAKGYNPKGDKKQDVDTRRVMHVTCRMLEDDHEKFVPYCEERFLTLSDALNDFAQAVMTQDFGLKVAKFLEEHRWQLYDEDGNLLEEETLARTRKRVGDRIKDEVEVEYPVHCRQCGKSCLISFDSSQTNEMKKLAWVDGEVFCSWECSYLYLDAKMEVMNKKYYCNRCKTVYVKEENPPLTILNPLDEQELYCEKCVLEVKGNSARMIPEEYKYRCSVCLKEKDERRNVSMVVKNKKGESGKLCGNCFNLTFGIKRKKDDVWKYDDSSQTDSFENDNLEDIE